VYLSFYKLTTKPFPEKTDPARLWLHDKIKKGLAAFRDGILENRGIMLLTGDVGTGKTSFINILVSSLPENVVVGNVLNPGLDRQGHLQVLADIFHLDKNEGDPEELLTTFTQFLVTAAGAGKKVLLIIDEAQQLSEEALELIQLLADLDSEDNSSKLLSIILVGQNDANAALFRPEHTELRQKIVVTYNIIPLTKTETEQYIKHHLRLAGGPEDIFSPEAMVAVFTFTGGSPRLINLICDLALLNGFTSASPVISKETVSDCTKKLMLPHDKDSHPKPVAAHKADTIEIEELPTGRQRKTGWGKPSFGVLLLIVLILFGARQFINKMDIPDDPVTTGRFPTHNKTTAFPKAEFPSQTQTQPEFVAPQPSKTAAEQPSMPQRAVTTRDSVAPQEETVQITAKEDTPPVIDDEPLKNAEPTAEQASVSQPTTEVPPVAVTSPDSPVLKHEKPLPVKKETPPEIIATSDLRNGSEKVLTVFFGNLRDGPSMEANIIGVAKQGDTVIDLREKESWHFVKLVDGRLGWMHQSLFAIPKIAINELEKPAVPSATAKPATQPQAVPKSRVNIRPLAVKKALPGKKETPAPSVAETSPAQTPPAPEPAATEPVTTAKDTSSISIDPPALQKPIVKTDNPEAQEWTQKSFESVSKGRFNLAIDEASKAIGLDPGLVNPYINRAWAYCEKGLYEKAIADCYTALALDPKNALALNNIGLAFHRLEELATAQEYYKKACDLKLEVACSNYKLLRSAE
jgi:type II secretory pathway predicted ATPase ExeA